MTKCGQHEQSQEIHRAKMSSLLRDYCSGLCCRSGFHLLDQKPRSVDRLRFDVNLLVTNGTLLGIRKNFCFMEISHDGRERPSPTKVGQRDGPPLNAQYPMEFVAHLPGIGVGALHPP